MPITVIPLLLLSMPDGIQPALTHTPSAAAPSPHRQTLHREQALAWLLGQEATESHGLRTTFRLLLHTPPSILTLLQLKKYLQQGSTATAALPWVAKWRTVSVSPPQAWIETTRVRESASTRCMSPTQYRTRPPRCGQWAKTPLSSLSALSGLEMSTQMPHVMRGSRRRRTYNDRMYTLCTAVDNWRAKYIRSFICSPFTIIICNQGGPKVSIWHAWSAHNCATVQLYNCAFSPRKEIHGQMQDPRVLHLLLPTRALSAPAQGKPPANENSMGSGITTQLSAAKVQIVNIPPKFRRTLFVGDNEAHTLLGLARHTNSLQ